MLLDLAFSRPSGISSDFHRLNLCVFAFLNTDLFACFALLGIEEYILQTRVLRCGARKFAAFTRS